MSENSLHDAVRILRTVQQKGNDRLDKLGTDSRVSLGTVLSPPPGINVLLDDMPDMPFTTGEILLNYTLLEHRYEKAEVVDHMPGEHTISDGEIAVKLPILKAGDRVLCALIARQKVVVIAKVVSS